MGSNSVKHTTPRRGTYRVIIIGVPIITIVSWAVISAGGIISFKRAIYKEHSEIITRMLRSLSIQVEKDIQYGDYNQVIKTVGDFYDAKHMNYLSIALKNGKVIAEFPVDKKRIGAEANAGMLFRSNVYDGQNDIIGTILLEANMASTRSAAMKQVGYYILFGLLILGVEISIMVMLTRRFIRPLSVFAKEVKSFNPDDYERIEEYIQNYQERMCASKELQLYVEAYCRSIRSILKHKQESERLRVFASIGQSTAMVAHDVRKPLTSMKALLTMLPAIKDNPQQVKKMIASVDRNIANTNAMLNDILDFSKDSTDLELKNHDPQSIITSALSDVLRNHPNSDVSIEYELRHKDYLHVDGDRIIRVLTNIIDNAIDVLRVPSLQTTGGQVGQAMTDVDTDKAVGKLWLGTETVTQDGRPVIRIKIADSGPGIPENVLSKIFDPFFTSGKKGGTGLGLAICQKIIKLHGGRIEARSREVEKQRGAEFIIELPAHVGQLSINESELIRHSSELKAFREEEAVRVDYGDTANTTEFMRINKERGRLSYILIVDDEPLFRETVRILLSGLPQVKDHVSVVEADSAEMALKLFDDRVFDYVVADIDLGKRRMSGYEFTQIVLKKYSNTYALIHSNKRREELDIQLRAAARDESQTTLHESRFMGFLPKPMRASELLQFLACKSFEAPSSPTIGAPAGESMEAAGRVKRVLVVNDDETVNLSMKFSLKSDEIQVLDATNVSDALARLAANNVDIILSDVNLGENVPDGYEFLKKVREQGKNVPFYFMSGYSRTDQWPRAKEMGADGYLQLPVETGEIKKILGV